MKAYKLYVEFEDSTTDILEEYGTTLEEAINKTIKYNLNRLNSILFKDKTSKIINIKEFK